MSVQTIQYTAGGLANGTQITTSTTGSENGVTDTTPSFVTNTAGVITASTAQALRSPSLQYAQASGGAAYAQWNFASAASQFVGRIYLYMTAVSGAGSWPLVTLVDTVDSTNNSIIRLSGSTSDTPNRLRLASTGNNNLVSSTTSQLIPTNQWVRIEWVFDYIALNNSATLYLGDSTSAQFSISTPITASPPSGATSIRVGNTAASPQLGTLYIDDVKSSAGTTTPLGPAGAAPAPPTLTVWNGTSEVSVNSVTVWNGTSEVTTNSVSVN